VPVAAFPVTGPCDVVGDAPVGVLSEDLAQAAQAALALSPQACRDHAARFSWTTVACEFLSHLRPFGDSTDKSPRTAQAG